MGRVLICALASLAVWFLLHYFAAGFMGELGDGLKVILVLIIFAGTWHFSRS